MQQWHTSFILILYNTVKCLAALASSYGRYRISFVSLSKADYRMVQFIDYRLVSEWTALSYCDGVCILLNVEDHHQALQWLSKKTPSSVSTGAPCSLHCWRHFVYTILLHMQSMLQLWREGDCGFCKVLNPHFRIPTLTSSLLYHDKANTHVILRTSLVHDH